MKLIVNEIFYSLQGEGGRQGEASIFIRLTKCNLKCVFCDTEFDTGEEMTLQEIADTIEPFGCKWIIWTGGEPTIQLKDEYLQFFKDLGYKQAIETNGTKKVSSLIDYITCSPKQNYPRIKELIPSVDEIRIPVAKGDEIPEIAVFPKAKRYFLSPIFDGKKPIEENINYCVEQILKNPDWQLSLQVHKLINIE